MPIIVLDPGHGGTDPGAVAFGLMEKDITLDIVKKIREKLSAYQVEVHLTRDADVDMSLYDRASMANKLGADYFMSVHVNAGGGTGFESYVYTYAGNQTISLRDIIHVRVSSYYQNAGFVDRGKKSANFAVLRLTDMPAILLENLFIDRQQDAAKLADSSFRTGIARAVSAGLVGAFNLNAVVWDPASEINSIKSDGLITSDHVPDEKLVWSLFAAVINRYRGRSSTSDPWNPGSEVGKLKSDGLINSDHDPAAEVVWGEFATVLNRLRGIGVSSPWDPAVEIQKLINNGLLKSNHDPAATVNWGEFAAVLNRLRGK